MYTTITTSETGSGVTEIQYSINNGSTWTKLNLAKSNGIQHTGNIYYGKENWNVSNGRDITIYFRAKDGAGNISQVSDAFIVRYDTQGPTITISRTDYNTFSWTASDTGGLYGWQITNSSTAPTSGWTTTGTLTGGSRDITSAGTYYVWVRDTAGNAASKNITACTISRSEGTGTTLTTRYDSTSSSSGTGFTNNMVMLAGTPIWAKADRNPGYTGTVTLKHGSTNMTASGSTFNVGATETITSGGVTAATYTVTYNKNDSEATGTMSNGTATYNANFTPAANGFTNNKVFTGWNTSADGTGTAWTAGTPKKYETAGNTTLYAIWKPNKLTVKMYANGVLLCQ